MALVLPGQLLGQRLPLPDPPEQRTPWRAPHEVPTNLLSAAQALFEQGFADPRGCEYREIEVEVSGVWGGKVLAARTRGWVLPGKGDQEKQFAICWNGLIYPVRDVGDSADLHAEVAGLKPPGPRRFNDAVGEVLSVFSSNALSSRVLLLLRCGEAGTTMRVFAPTERLALEWRARTGKRGSDAGVTNAYDPYLQFASDWA